MKKEHAFWAAVCLLLSVVPELPNALPEEDDDTINSDSQLRPMKPLHTFCAMKAEEGPCKAMIWSYYFNMYTHQCEQFVYGGCRGNENRFDTLEECRKTCIPGYKQTTVKTASGAEKPDFCFLEEDPGICRGFMNRYFYNNQSKQCEKFKYGGCLGNSNNFETLDECKNTCEDPVNELQNGDFVTDRNTVTDQTTVTERNTVTVRTTVNNIVIPQSTKVPSRWGYDGPSWCLEPADSGLCTASEKRFYYNSTIGKCLHFNYTGCGGNNNNFTTKRNCRRACIKDDSKKGSKRVKTQRRRKSFVKVIYENIH